MSTLALSDAVPPLRYRHASRADYAAFLHTRPSVHEPRHYLYEVAPLRWTPIGVVVE